MSHPLHAYAPAAPAVLLFGLHRGTGVISKLIQFQTRSPYSHVSIVDGAVLLEAKEGRGVIHERPVAAVLAAEAVDVVAVRCTPAQRESALAFARAQVGKRYDYTSVARFVSRRQARRKDAEVWFCSELAFAAAQQAGLDLLRETEPWEVSPGLFARSPLLVSLADPPAEMVAAIGASRASSPAEHAVASLAAALTKVAA